MHPRFIENTLALALVVFVCIGLYACFDDHRQPYQDVHHEQD